MERTGEAEQRLAAVGPLPPPARSTAQLRFTAVGRVAHSIAPAWSILTMPLRERHPQAAATPMAGAPRTAMSRIPPATADADSHRIQSSRLGRALVEDVQGVILEAKGPGDHRCDGTSSLSRRASSSVRRRSEVKTLEVA